MTSQGPRSLPPRSSRPWVTLAVAAVGLGLNLRASILLAPHLYERFSVGPEAYVALIGLPVLMAAVVRLPVGVLTDRYGARVMFPVVSLVAAASVAGLALAGSLTGVVVAGTAAGSAGAAFVVGSALVSRSFPYGRRGRALGAFGLGVAVAGTLSATSWAVDREGRMAALVLAAVLVGFAGLAAAVLRDPVAADQPGSLVRRCAEMIRLASGTSVSLLYVLALGGIVSVAVYLPIYLATAYGFEWHHALAVTAPLVVVASVARLAGGWWTDRRPTARLLVVCYGVAAGLALVGALTPAWWLAAPVIIGIALCDGIASGALLALIGKAARPRSAGAVLGVTGAAGALGALLPPLLFAGLHRLTDSYVTAWTLLAAVLLAGALYVRTHGLSVGLGLAVEFEPEPSPTTMTVAVLGEPDTRLGAAAVVARLAELATSDELVVVYGTDEVPHPGLSARALTAGLRDRLPRHDVAAVHVHRHPEALGRDALLLGEFVEAGALTIAVTRSADLRTVAADLALYLQADRVVVVSFTPAEGAALHPV
jgi:NNP family nitrate/nitrite transporter-like MFS transporter